MNIFKIIFEKKMKKIFFSSFKDVMSKENRQKIYYFLKEMVEEEDLSSDEKYNLFLYIMYEIHTEWISLPKLEDLYTYIKRKKFGYEHEQFYSIRKSFQEEETFISNPPVIEEGVIQCRKCKSKRTFSFNKQTRSSDEAVTVFVRCVDCNTQFRM